jgi:hypothetical protein
MRHDEHYVGGAGGLGGRADRPAVPIDRIDPNPTSRGR